MYITENYRRPDSFFKWLLWHSNDPAIGGIEHRTVIAFDVRFVTTQIDRVSRLTAVCSRAEGRNVELSVPAHAFPLKFDGTKCIDPEGNEVQSFATAFFLSDRIFVIPNISEAAPETEQAAA